MWSEIAPLALENYGSQALQWRTTPLVIISFDFRRGLRIRYVEPRPVLAAVPVVTTTVTSEKPRRPRGVSGTARVEAAEQRWEQRQFRASRSELEVPERLVRLRAQLDEATLLLDRCARVARR